MDKVKEFVMGFGLKLDEEDGEVYFEFYFIGGFCIGVILL